ncbi:sigma-54-dependent Fis family transcriptional regulator [candidate division WOR-3 bacterium]|uniref:Sigma-54-dependent Fis family transcriptional regulator n=1 Tax=candidate division WOR-3 bacterium TaxID=2052148 RepID=A0A660SGN0_UNCW3|nr:MAG: sigma-54-dependent Fis family transcriptional regulator [candidate division WOR-3 bacterium]
MSEVLVIEDKLSFADLLKRKLKELGIDSITTESGKKGLDLLTKHTFRVVILDLRLPDADGIDILKEIKEADPSIEVIIISAYGTIERAVEAMRLGAHDFIPKPVDPEHLGLIVLRLLRERRLKEEYLMIKKEWEEQIGFEIVGVSKALQEALYHLKKAAASDATVLLIGESGTGKELFAHALHRLSRRKNRPFVPINCAAIPRELLENELFGSERGAFTGATARKIGKLEIAHQGTVFLDEVADLDLSLQAKILRVIEDKTFERLGGLKPIRVDVRFVAATNRDLKTLVIEKKFREDLYYRLNVFPIALPPLRERKEDIPHLVEHFLKKLGVNKSLNQRAMDKLFSYHWPGNVRELENVIERATILCEGDLIGPSHILLPIENNFSVGSLKEAKKRSIRAVERDLIIKVLRETKGNKKAAAEKLGISYKTLLKRIKEYGID